MIDTAEVYLWGTRIGYIHQSEGDIAANFEYDKEFQNSGIEVSPFKMPNSRRIYTFPELAGSDAFRGMPGLVADSLPDKFGNSVIDNWLLSQGRDPGSFTAIERLCYTGKRGMGALEYVPATYNGMQAGETIDVTEMTKLASEILIHKTKMTFDEKEANMARLVEIGSSAGGARAKAVIAWNEMTGEIKSGQVNAGEGFDYWLIKFDGVAGNGDHNMIDKKQYSLIEYAYYLMTRDLDINMSECRIYRKDGLNHFITKRYDRANGQKLHTQTLAALCHFDYNIPGLCS